MGFIIKILLTALAVYFVPKFLPGISVNGFGYAIVLVLVLTVLNAIVRPILVFLTIPVTVLTLGLFLLIINAIIILLADYLMGPNFETANFLWALVFSIILSIITAIIDLFT